ncbi:MAG TPA: DUF2783 domain-containing protein [Burkholderiales bacterium]|jgi:hypothetical protein
MLTPEQLDEVYTRACHTMTELGETLGEKQTELFLARLALLLMKEVGDPARIQHAITTAREGMQQQP